MHKKLIGTLLLSACGLSASTTARAAEVIAFWGFEDSFDLTGAADGPFDKINFLADVDNTVGGGATLQAFRGGGDLRQESGGGKRSYTTVDGVTHAPTQTVEWDDLRGGGDDFDIGGVTDFSVDKGDGSGPVTDQFGNDALMYFTLDTSNFRDLQFRFEVEATPGDLPQSFDIFTRVAGDVTWERAAAQNNIPLAFQDYSPVDPDNQFAETGFIALSSDLADAGMIEIIVNDFDEEAVNGDRGNGEMEIDNIEFIGTAVPEPGTVGLLSAGGLWWLGRRRRRRSGRTSTNATAG